MSDLLRALRATGTEREQRQTQRAIDRLIRAARQDSPLGRVQYTPPDRPVFPAGVVPVVLLNPPIVRGGRIF